MILRRLAAALLIALTAAPATRADAGSAQVFGQVFDPAGRPLEGVNVELIGLATGKVRTALTDRAGAFAFDRLPSGRYTLSLLHERYAAKRLPPEELLPNVPVEVSVQLEPLYPPMTRPASGIDTIALEYGLVREQIAAMPTLLGAEGRTAVDRLLHLAPGLTPVDQLEIGPLSGVAAAVSANGSRRSAINYQFDGASNNAQNRITGAQAATFAPVPEAIETFRVVTHTYSARDGRNAGAVVSPVTRSGGEAWHGQARGFYRPQQGTLASFDGSEDALRGWAGGGQLGGPLWAKRQLFTLIDAEGWMTSRRRLDVSPVLSMAERSGDLSGALEPALDPRDNTPFPDGVIPPSRLDPLVQKYLDAFLPPPNIAETVHATRQTLASNGQTLVARLDWRRRRWTVNASHLVYRSRVESPVDETIHSSPGVLESRRQLSNHLQIGVAFAPTPNFQQTTRIAGQRLSINRWLGRPDFRNVTADEFGFDYESFGATVGAIPDVTLYDDAGLERLRITPFAFSEASAQTTYQVSHDAEYRLGATVVRGGGLYRRGFWPFITTENFAGSFSFPAPAEPPIRTRPNGLRDLLLGLPGEYRLQTPRDLNLRWSEVALYGETELRPLRQLRLTLGVRYEAQPPAVDTQDRIAAFRPGEQSQRFPLPNTLPNLIFPGDSDGEFGPLSRSTVSSRGRNIVPRLGVSYAPSVDDPTLRRIFGEAGRSVFRASYGVFYDFGAFAGSSAASLFEATYPPFSVDNRFDFSRAPEGQAFRSPLGSTPNSNPAQFVPTLVRYPIQVFDRDFRNAQARQLNVGFQRLLPNNVLVSGIYVRTRSEDLQRQRELNAFVRNALRPFAFVRSMRLFSRYTDVRQFESTGVAQYDGFQLRANRYLRQGLAFDVGYTLSKSEDNGSSVFGEGLATEAFTVSDFDRRHNLTAVWLYETRLPRSWPRRFLWLDRWTISGVWRWRSGLPLDIRQNEDPTFTFEQVGRPDIDGAFRLLDPDTTRTFTLPDGREATGPFVFDPTVFTPVVPTDFDETRQGNVPRNAFRGRGYQQWDLRLARRISVSEQLTAEFGVDLLNVFGNRNWAEPFTNVDHPYFGIARAEGLGRTMQAALRLEF